MTEEDILSTWNHVAYRFKRVRELLGTPEQEKSEYELDAAIAAIKNLQQLAGYGEKEGPAPFRITVHDEHGKV